MSKLLVSDELWNLVEPILPKHPYVPGIGKARVPDRVCLTGILFVLKTGIPWEDFPHEMGCCGMTLWNRLDEWRRAGVWDQLHRLVLNQLRADEQIDLSRVIVDSSSVRAVHGGKKRDQAPWTAGKMGRNTTSLLMRAVYLLPTPDDYGPRYSISSPVVATRIPERSRQVSVEDLGASNVLE